MRFAKSAVQRAVVAAGISLVAFTTLSASSSGIINKPSGVVAGDVIVIFAWATDSSAAWSVPSGFTDAQAGAGAQFGACYKVAGGSEPSTYQLTNGGTYMGLCCAAFRGSSGFDAKGAYATATGASTITAPSVTAVAANCLLIGGFAAGGNVNFSTPSGMTFVGRATDPAVGIFYQQLSSTGATGTRVTTPSGSGYDVGSMLITIKP